MWFIFLSFAGSIAFTIVRIILAPSVAPSSESTIRVKSDYVLMLVQCFLGLLAMLIPGMLRRMIRLDIPSVMIIAYAVFLYCAIYLGEVRDFYHTIPYWDTILHTFSGAALGALGFSLVSILNKSDLVVFSLSPVFMALFAFGFAVSLGVLWEIYEYSVDALLKTNAQKYALKSGQLLVGQAALSDTMKDLIVDAIGALTMAVIGFISMKYKKGWLHRFQLTHVNEKTDT